MAIQIKKFVRKPFGVEAVEVTAENMEAVAEWCKGQVRTQFNETSGASQHYIKVAVKRPLNERQTKAYAGDYVVAATAENIKGFKVYTPKAFTQSFDELMEDLVETLERMDERAAREDKYEEDGGFAEELRVSSPVQP